jgi:hypothetical protein
MTVTVPPYEKRRVSRRVVVRVSKGLWANAGVTTMRRSDKRRTNLVIVAIVSRVSRNRK